jgi:hypothetical protein
MKEGIIDHLMKMVAIYNNGNDRKGKLKRISRSEQFIKLTSYFSEKKILEKYDEIIGERNERFRKRDEENERFWKRIREEDYYKRRKSEPKIIIPDLSNDTILRKEEPN